MSATMKAVPTPGPWEFRSSGSAILNGNRTEFPNHVVWGHKDSLGRRCTAFVATCESATLDNEANARLIAAAPAQDLILQMCELGVARLEVCSHEFVFNGLRYAIGEDRNWGMVLDVIGWDVARAAIQKAQSGK